MKAEKVAEKVKSAVIPGIEATRNFSFAGVYTKRDPSSAQADSG